MVLLDRPDYTCGDPLFYYLEKFLSTLLLPPFRKLSCFLEDLAMFSNLLIEFFDADVINCLCGHYRDIPRPRSIASVKHRLYIINKVVCSGAVSFVDHEYVGNLEQTCFHGLYAVSSLGRQGYDHCV